MDIVHKYFADFTPQQNEQFEALGKLYGEWNEMINVISRKDIGGLYEKHVLHSLSIAATFDFEAGTEIMDLGTGGGFPGIPLAIYFPEVKFHLVDSIAKKLKVVSAVAEAIGVNNITVQHVRAEEIKNRKFDFVVSRAVAPLKDLWHWSKPLIRSARHQQKNSSIEQAASNENLPPTPGLICLKGGDLSTEIQESGMRPRMIEIDSLFPEEYFKEKYLLYLPK